MLQDRFVNILNMNKTHLLYFKTHRNVIFGDLTTKTCCWQEEVSPLVPCNQATFCPTKPQKRCSNLTSSWSWISYTFGTKSKSKSARPSKGGRRELSSSQFHSWAPGTPIWQMSHELSVSKLGPWWLQPDPSVWLYPLKHVLWQMSLAWFGWQFFSCSSLSLFLITFDFSSEENFFSQSYFYGNFNESLGMTLITEVLKCLQIVFSFLWIPATHFCLQWNAREKKIFQPIFLSTNWEFIIASFAYNWIKLKPPSLFHGAANWIKWVIMVLLYIHKWTFLK